MLMFILREAEFKESIRKRTSESAWEYFKGGNVLPIRQPFVGKSRPSWLRIHKRRLPQLYLAFHIDHVESINGGVKEYCSCRCNA